MLVGDSLWPDPGADDSEDAGLLVEDGGAPGEGCGRKVKDGMLGVIGGSP